MEGRLLRVSMSISCSNGDNTALGARLQFARYMSKVLLFSIGGRRVCVLCEVVERAASKQVELEDVPVDHVKTIPTTC